MRAHAWRLDRLRFKISRPENGLLATSNLLRTVLLTCSRILRYVRQAKKHWERVCQYSQLHLYILCKYYKETVQIKFPLAYP